MRIGQRVKVTDAGWARYEQETGHPPVLQDRVQHVFDVRPPDWVILTYPIFWFRVDEVVPVE